MLAAPPHVTILPQAPRAPSLGWGVHESPFGRCWVAANENAVWGLGFLHPSSDTDAAISGLMDQILRSLAPAAKMSPDNEMARAWTERIFGGTASSVSVSLGGTPFQRRVWDALLKIPVGQVTTYQTIADAIGTPRACRAVGSAIGRNPVSWLIPCHRVVQAAGGLGGYRWGVPCKRTMLAAEARAFAEATLPPTRAAPSPFINTGLRP